MILKIWLLLETSAKQYPLVPGVHELVDAGDPLEDALVGLRLVSNLYNKAVAVSAENQNKLGGDAGYAKWFCLLSRPGLMSVRRHGDPLITVLFGLLIQY